MDLGFEVFNRIPHCDFLDYNKLRLVIPCTKPRRLLVVLSDPRGGLAGMEYSISGCFLLLEVSPSGGRYEAGRRASISENNE